MKKKRKNTKILKKMNKKRLALKEKMKKVTKKPEEFS
jgi:hypothetical protein